MNQNCSIYKLFVTVNAIIVNMENRQVKALNLIKGIGACIVAFAWHYQHFEPVHGSPFITLIPVSYTYGWLMVELFFMLSGFGMAMGYTDRIMQDKISFRDYMSKRLLKLYPLFFLSTMIVTVLEILIIAKTGETFVYPNFDIFHFILNVLFLQDGIIVNDWSFNSPSWCISICFLMYILFYLICHTAKSRSSVYIIHAVLIPMGLTFITLQLNLPLINVLTGRGISCFSIGVLLEWLYEHRERFSAKRIGTICLCLTLISYLLIRFKPWYYAANPQQAFICTTGPMIIVSVLFIPGLQRILEIRPLQILGSLFIHIYLLHFPVQCLIRVIDLYAGLHIDYSAHVSWIIYAAAVLLSSCLNNRFCKAPAERLLRKLFQ